MRWPRKEFDLHFAVYSDLKANRANILALTQNAQCRDKLKFRCVLGHLEQEGNVTGSHDHKDAIRTGCPYAQKVAKDPQVPVVPAGSPVGTHVITCAADFELRHKVTALAVTKILRRVEEPQMTFQCLFGLG